MKYIIGVDIGTSSTKAVAFDLEGDILWKKSIGYPILNPIPTWSEQDPDEIFRAVINSVTAVIQMGKANKGELLGISFSAVMHSLIAVDMEGCPLTPCMIWADTRSKEYAKTLRESKEGTDIYIKTGTPIHPMAPICKIMWLKDHKTEIFHQAYKFISIKEYVFFRLFGTYQVDFSVASTTGLFDIHHLKWDNIALKMAGIIENQLSQVVSPTHVIRGLQHNYAKVLGISEETPFVIGASDGCLANLGMGILQAGDAAVTIGTSGAIRMTTDQPILDPRQRIFNYVLTEKYYIAGGAINSGGILLRWFREQFGQIETMEGNKRGIHAYEVLMEEAKKIQAGSNGLLFLPYLLGERAPIWDPDAKGVFFGIQINHTKEHFIRALLEGMMYSLYSIGKVLEGMGGQIQEIYASGGFTQSELWVQILSDVFGKKVHIANTHESSSFGAVIVGMKALGIIKDFEKKKVRVKIAKTFDPNQEHYQIYQKMSNYQEELYHALKESFEKF